VESHAPPPPTGAGLAQGGASDHVYNKKISTGKNQKTLSIKKFVECFQSDEMKVFNFYLYLRKESRLFFMKCYRICTITKSFNLISKQVFSSILLESNLYFPEIISKIM
jgi:hypothetical protein